MRITRCLLQSVHGLLPFPSLALLVSRAAEERQLDRGEGYNCLRPCVQLTESETGLAEEHRTGHQRLGLNSRDLLGLGFPACEGAILASSCLSWAHCEARG